MTRRNRRIMPNHGEARLYSPAAARNREPIFQVLEPTCRSAGLSLKSRADQVSISSISRSQRLRQHRRMERRTRLVQCSPGGCAQRRVIGLAPPTQTPCYASIMIHIALWTATIGLMRGTAQLLPLGCMLYLYAVPRRDQTASPDCWRIRSPVLFRAEAIPKGTVLLLSQ